SETIGIASNLLDCLASDESSDVPSQGTVELRWNGEVEQARLILSVSGAEAPHTIRLNGQPIAAAPLFPEGQFCGEGEVFYLDIPSSAVVQGTNIIELTNDALSNDSWSASSIRLEVLGRLTQEGVPPARDQALTAATAATPNTFNFVS